MERQNGKSQNGTLGIIAGAVFVIAAIAFVVSGGGFGGKTVVDGDEDLPPVAQGAQTGATSTTTGGTTGQQPQTR
jgi:hypothetical protein